MTRVSPTNADLAAIASRRRFLARATIGAAGMPLAGVGGLNLAGLLQARAAQAAATPGAPAPPAIRSCIFIFYFGGPSHLDTFDMKPDAPAEVRGEFQSIDTSAPGVRICEYLPLTSRIMHKVAVVRSLTHNMRLHDAACVESLTGRMPARGDGENFVPPQEHTLFPNYGAALHYVRRHEPLPVHAVGLPFVFHNVVPEPCQTGGFLGSAYNPFLVTGDPTNLGFRADMLALPESLSLDRVAGRGGLLRQIDQASGREAALGALGRPLDDLYDRAIDLLASPEVRRALEIEREDEATRARYGRATRRAGVPEFPAGSNEHAIDNAAQLRGQSLLMARRLVEAGVPFVNVYDYRQQGTNWDAHANNFVKHRDLLLPPCDQAYSALIEDLEQRGLLESTLVVAMGEFGRTPKINGGAGRDHWPDCYFCLLAGGGIQGGQVYGASDKIGAYPDVDPVTPGDLAATIFWRFGIDPGTEIHDTTNRPYRLAEGQPLRTLFG
jgi:hypothetical protein